MSEQWKSHWAKTLGRNFILLRPLRRARLRWAAVGAGHCEGHAFPYRPGSAIGGTAWKCGDDGKTVEKYKEGGDGKWRS